MLVRRNGLPSICFRRTKKKIPIRKRFESNSDWIIGASESEIIASITPNTSLPLDCRIALIPACCCKRVELSRRKYNLCSFWFWSNSTNNREWHYFRQIFMQWFKNYVKYRLMLFLTRIDRKLNWLWTIESESKARRRLNRLYIRVVNSPITINYLVLSN